MSFSPIGRMGKLYGRTFWSYARNTGGPKQGGEDSALITQEVIMELVLSVRHCSGTMELQKTNSLSVLIGLQ